MTQLQVIVPKLNKRTFPVQDTSDKSNIVGEVLDGFIFESKSQLTNNLGLWYQDQDGYYYWSGGVKENPDQLLSLSHVESSAGDAFASQENAAWLNFLGLSEIWKITKGDLVNVAVLDSGINLQNAELTNKLFSPATDLQVCRNIIDDNDDVSDKLGHGTMCSSLVSFENSSATIGVAPNARLFIGKISEMGETKYEIIAKGILWAADIKEVDIISISFGLNQEDPSFQKLKEAFDYAISKDKVIVAAIGDIDNNPSPVYPALFENCISVSACDALGNSWNGNVDYPATTIYAPGVDIMTYVVKNIYFPDGDTKSYKLSGTSQATAVTSGVLALIISLLKKKKVGYTNKYLKKLLTTYARPLQTGGVKKVIDPVTIFSNI
jgi:subtilisin family serine protease